MRIMPITKTPPFMGRKSSCKFPKDEIEYIKKKVEVKNDNTKKDSYAGADF